MDIERDYQGTSPLRESRILILVALQDHLDRFLTLSLDGSDAIVYGRNSDNSFYGVETR